MNCTDEVIAELKNILKVAIAKEKCSTLTIYTSSYLAFCLKRLIFTTGENDNKSNYTWEKWRMGEGGERVRETERQGQRKYKRMPKRSNSMSEGNGVSSFVIWYHTLRCLSISKGPWLSEFLMAPLNSCATLILKQKCSSRNTGINCAEYKLANRFIPHPDIINKYWWLPVV